MGKTRIKELRLEKGISQAKLGKEIGVTDRTISNYETGRTEPDIDATAKLCKIFGVTAGYLLGIEDE